MIAVERRLAASTETPKGTRLSVAAEGSFRRKHSSEPSLTRVLDSEVAGQRQLDLCKVIPAEVVDRVTDDVVNVDRTDLVYEHSREVTSDFELGTMHGWAS